ncbi:zinc finger, CCHC-type containing protein [Tanacetum coccineum]
MNQPLGFILPSNENKVCKLVKSLYGLKQTPKQWPQKFNEVVLSNGYLLNQADKCVYRKFDTSGKGVIICLYVDDMLIFDTNQVRVDLTKEFLSLRFSIKDMGDVDVILGIRIKHESNGIAISHSHYIEKVLKKFNYSDCTLISTPLDTYEKLMPNRGLAVSQPEYSRVIGCLMYAMTCTRPDIAFAVGKLSRYTSNPGTQHWQAIQRVLEYLKKTMDYRLVHFGYPSVLEGYTNASWISNTEDNSSISGWVFLLGGGVISLASKKQTCITGSIMESEFVALAAAGKKGEWLKNLLLEIPLWQNSINIVSTPVSAAGPSFTNDDPSSPVNAAKASNAFDESSLEDPSMDKKSMQEDLLQLSTSEGHTQEEGIDYDEVFAPVARIKVIKLFLAYASFMGLIVYQMDVKSSFLYGTIEEELLEPGMRPYSTITYWKMDTENRHIEKTLFIKKDRDEEVEDYACSLIQINGSVSPKVSHLHIVKRIFRYLKGQPKLGLWYPMDSPFDLEAFSDSDYAGASLDRKSTTRGCQFLGKRLISWKCKKQTIVANSTTEAEYVVAANCCGQVLWIQNQMLDYGFNFMNIKIHIDNESTICIVKNPVFHSKTKHIEIRHHFIRDSYEKKLIQVIKIHTDHNAADLLTKAFDVNRKAKRTTKISQSSGPIHLVANETVDKEWEDRMERAATTASSLEPK